MDFRELRAMVLLRVRFAIPEADAKNPIGLRIGDEHHLVNHAVLFFQDGNCLLIDGLCKVFRFS